MEEKNLQDRIPIKHNSSSLIVNYLPDKPKKFQAENSRLFWVKLFNLIISASLFFIFLGLPLFFTTFSYQGIIFEKQIYFYFFLLISLVFWIAKSLIKGELKIRRTSLDIFVLFFLVTYILAFIFSVDRWHSFWGFFGDPSRGLMNILALIVAYYLILDQLNFKKLKIISVAIAVSGFIILNWTILGVLGIKFLPEKISNVLPLSLIGSLSGVGAFISFLLPFFIACLLTIRSSKKLGCVYRKILMTFLGLAILLDIFLLLALYNYIPWIGLLIGLGIFLIYLLSRVVNLVEEWNWLPLVIFIIVMIISVIGRNISISKIDLPAEVSLNYNLSWEIAKNSIKEKLIWGSGPATYGYVFSLFKPEIFNQNYLYNLRFYQGTGLLAEGITTLGIFGLLFFILLILSYFSITFYLMAVQKEKNKILSLGFLSGTLIIIIYSLSMRIEGTILILGTLLSIVTLTSLLLKEKSQGKYFTLTFKSLPKYLLVLVLVIFTLIISGVIYIFIFIGKAFVADIYIGSVLKEKEISEGELIKKLDQAIKLNPYEGRYYTRLGQEYVVLANIEKFKNNQERNIKEMQRYLDLAILFSVKGRDLMKNDVLAVELLAQVYENAGLYRSELLAVAEETYRRALELEPQNPVYPIKIGQIKMNQAANSQSENTKKDFIRQAEDLFEKSIEKKQNLPEAYYQISVAQEALGEIDKAIENMKKAFQLEKENINYAFNLARLYQKRGGIEDSKIAENLFKQILGINNEEINTRFSLGLLYEKTGRNNEAINEYQKVLEFLSLSSTEKSENLEEAKEKIKKMIDNIQKGISNLNTEPKNQDASLKGNKSDY